jgi:hypothetical protein
LAGCSAETTAIAVRLRWVASVAFDRALRSI